MSHYKHFTTKEREKILFFLAQEKTISFIAKELQRDKSSVSREIKRNTNTEGIYSPSYANYFQYICADNGIFAINKTIVIKCRYS